LSEMYMREIVRLDGVPVSIVSNCDALFTSKFWNRLHEANGSKFNFSTVYHPQTDCQSERTIQTLEDVLRLCVLDFKGSWIQYLPLVTTIVFKQLLAWHHMKSCIGVSVDRLYTGMKSVKGNCKDRKMVQDMKDKIALIRKRMLTAQSRRKSYTDKHHCKLEFEMGYHVYLKVSPMRSAIRFGKKDKLSPSVCAP